MLEDREGYPPYSQEYVDRLVDERDAAYRDARRKEAALQDARHELATLHGLVACDGAEFSRSVAVPLPPMQHASEELERLVAEFWREHAGPGHRPLTPDELVERVLA